MYNLLTDPLIHFRRPGGVVRQASLPEVFAALMRDEVDAFPDLRAHQRHAWHAFLVQLGAMAVHRDGKSEPPYDPEEWHRIIRSLTSNDHPDDEPWQLVVDDITQPAFMQPPARSQDREKDYKSIVVTPDELDMLITSKNHDLKASVAEQASFDDWIFALITLQTMEGFGGAGNYGISRMNGGLGNRSAFTLAPFGQGPGAHVRRDIIALLEYRPAILENNPHYPANGGAALLWNLPWDGTPAEGLLLNRLDLFYIEVCRRIRLRSGDGRIFGIRTSSKAARIESKSLNGLTGDPWAPVDHRDKKGDKVLTLSAGGFHYKRVTDYLTSAEYGSPMLLRPTQSERQRFDEPMQLVARAMVRGQGKTEGYHERIIPVGHKLKSAMLLRNSSAADDLGTIAKRRIDAVGKIQRVLSHAIQVFAARGDHDKISPEHRERAGPWLDRLDEMVDGHFFEDLQEEFEETSEADRRRIRHQWLLNDEDKSGVVNHARALLSDATDSLPCPAIYRYKARESAEGLFEGRLRRGDASLPDLFVQGNKETEE